MRNSTHTASGKTKLMDYYYSMRMPAVITFFSLLFLSLSIYGPVNVAAGSISNSQIEGGEEQELQEEHSQIPQNRNDNATMAITNSSRTNANVATGIVDSANNNDNNATSLYENVEYGMQIRYPDDWIYIEDENLYPFDFGVVFMSPRDAFEVGTTVESGGTPEIPPSVAAVVMELPFSGNIDAQLLEEIVTSGLTSEGYEIISSNPNTTLSGMPALEVVAVAPENEEMGIQIWTIQGGRAYAVIYVSDESRFDQSLPIAQDMISSFSLMDEFNTTVTTTPPPLTSNNNNGNATATVQEEQQQQQQQQAEWLPYDNPTYGVRMLYPSTWIQQGGPPEEVGYIIVSDFFTPEEEVGSYASVTIMIDNMPLSTSVEDYLREAINIYTRNPTFQNFQVLSSSTDDFTLAGVPAYSLEATYTDPEFGSQHMLEVGTIIENKGYLIQYFADPPVYQTHFSIAERMIESFQINHQQSQQQENEEEEEGQQNQGDSFSAIPWLFQTNS
ncbi:MAG: hypothetical protein M3115_05720 [Thermoproteota archaeon]|nr:hypothetical protein [Thermoproteota archaeon]